MISLLGAICVACVGAGGFLFGSGDTTFVAPFLVVVGSLGSAILLGLVQRGIYTGLAVGETLTAGGIRTALFESQLTMEPDDRRPDDMPVYVSAGDCPLMPATGLFNARVDGQRMLVIEGGNSGKTV